MTLRPSPEPRSTTKSCGVTFATSSIFSTVDSGLGTQTTSLPACPTFGSYCPACGGVCAVAVCASPTAGADKSAHRHTHLHEHTRCCHVHNSHLPMPWAAESAAVSSRFHEPCGQLSRHPRRRGSTSSPHRDAEKVYSGTQDDQPTVAGGSPVAHHHRGRGAPVVAARAAGRSAGLQVVGVGVDVVCDLPRGRRARSAAHGRMDADQDRAGRCSSRSLVSFLPSSWCSALAACCPRTGRRAADGAPGSRS